MHVSSEAISTETNLTHALEATALSGMLDLQVSIHDPSNSVHSVQYLINDDDNINPTSIAPYSMQWHSSTVWDGLIYVRAIGLAIGGEVVCTSDPISIHINNNDGYSFDLISPAMGDIVSGEIDLSVQVSHHTHTKPADWPLWLYVDVYIDGKTFFSNDFWNPVFDVIGVDSYNLFMNIDTRKLSNGRHQVSIRTIYDHNPMSDDLGGFYTYIDVQNDLSVVDIQPTMQDIYLQVGESHTLEMKEVLNDYSERAFTGNVEYSIATQLFGSIVDGSSFISIDSGVLTANEVGVTEVHTSVFGQYNHTVRVIVSSDQIFPHYSRNGALLTEYNAGESQITRTMFHLRDEYIAETAFLEEQLQAAAINTIESALHKTVTDGAVSNIIRCLTCQLFSFVLTHTPFVHCSLFLIGS